VGVSRRWGVVPYSRAWTSSVQTLIRLTPWPGLMNRALLLLSWVARRADVGDTPRPV